MATATEQLRVQQPPAEDRWSDPHPFAVPDAEVTALVEYIPVWPFMILVALGTIAFAPLFVALALVVLVAVAAAMPFMLIWRLLRRG